MTCLEISDNKWLAAGYHDGNVLIFDLKSKSVECQLSLHKTAIQSLKFDAEGLRLLSGGLDNDLVVSDIVDQKGKYRLSGHVAPITSCLFIEKFKDVAVSSSKDMQIKFWNIETQYCFLSIVDFHSEVWGLTLMRNEDYLVAGSKENSLRVYKLVENKPDLSDESLGPLKANIVGTIQRNGKGRTVNLVADSEGQVLACNGTDNEIELFYFNTMEESLKSMSKRLKKLSMKTDDGQQSRELSLSDEIRRITSIKVKEKIKSLDIFVSGQRELRIAVVTNNNMIRLYSILDIKQKNSDSQLIRSISQQGHHTEVRTVAFSSDNLAIASCSGESLKLWNRSSLACIRTVESEYVICSCFVPGDRHVILGCKSGNLIITDIVIGEIVETIQAHEKELWSVILTPDQRGCVTGGGDQTVKFWSFELVDDAKNDSIKVLSLVHRSTLELEESVLAVRITPDGKYVACALLDSTVKIFFMDSFKFFLSLYGHKLPVLCCDISYDSALIATGSADRNVKIWGMDFGDCHRSLFAHDDSVMALQFVPKTHMFFTCGKDGKIKQWDADTFDKILTLQGHIGEAWNIAISPSGKFLVSCGSDKTLRLYERSSEILVLQDEQEEERERLENATLATGEESEVPGLPGLNLPSRKTVGSERAAENILECLEISKKFDEDSAKVVPPIMMFYEAENTGDYLVSVLSKIRGNDLEEALLLLPFSNVCEILEKLPSLAEKRKDQSELICKVTIFLFRIHHKPIVNSKTLLPTIRKLIKHLETAVTEQRDIIGSNIHAMGILQRRIENSQNIELFKDATQTRKAKERRKKQQRIAKRLHMQMSG